MHQPCKELFIWSLIAIFFFLLVYLVFKLFDIFLLIYLENEKK